MYKAQNYFFEMDRQSKLNNAQIEECPNAKLNYNILQIVTNFIAAFEATLNRDLWVNQPELIFTKKFNYAVCIMHDKHQFDADLSLTFSHITVCEEFGKVPYLAVKFFHSRGDSELKGALPKPCAQFILFF